MQVINDNSTNSTFAERQKHLFDILQNVAEDLGKDKDHSTVQKSRLLELNITRQKELTKRYKKEKSIFLKPNATPPRIARKQRAVNLKLSPKWTKYTLSDVTAEDMSEESNTRAALSFLKELQGRKNVETMEVEEIGKPVFIRPRSVSDTNTEDDGKSVEKPGRSFVSNKLIMPEYVVGAKIARKRPYEGERKGGEEIPRSKIKLDHLSECEDEE